MIPWSQIFNSGLRKTDDLQLLPSGFYGCGWNPMGVSLLKLDNWFVFLQKLPDPRLTGISPLPFYHYSLPNSGFSPSDSHWFPSVGTLFHLGGKFGWFPCRKSICCHFLPISSTKTIPPSSLRVIWVSCVSINYKLAKFIRWSVVKTSCCGKKT